MHKITVIRGDGVGPEICDAAIRVIEGAGVKCEWDFALVGREAEKQYGAPLPGETLEKIRASRLALKGPVVIEKMGDKVVISHDDHTQRVYSNVNTALRLELGAYVNVRPLRAFGRAFTCAQAGRGGHQRTDRGFVQRIRAQHGEDAAEAIKITTRRASERAARFAFEYA